jgi:hypothetical protein
MMAFGVWVGISTWRRKRKHQKSRSGAVLKEEPRLAGMERGIWKYQNLTLL